MRYHLKPVRMAIIKMSTNAGVGVEIREHSCTLCGNLNWHSYFGRGYGESFKNIGIKPPYDPAIPLRHVPCGNQNLKRHMYPNVHWGLFIITTTWEQYRCASTYDWIKNLCYMYKMEYSVQFSCSVMSDSLQPHWLQQDRPSCPSPTLEFTQTHVQAVSDAIHPSHPLSSPSPPAFKLSQHQGIFQRASSSHQVAKLLEIQLQHQSFQWTHRTGWVSLQSKGLSRVLSNPTVQKHELFDVQLSSQSNSHPSWPLEKP